MMEKYAKIYVAGHRGMVGSAIVRELQRQGIPILLPEPIVSWICAVRMLWSIFLLRKSLSMYF